MGANDAEPHLELILLLDALRQSPTRSSADKIRIAIEILRFVDSGPYKILAFVRGRVRSVQREWGDNGRSFWAHLYCVPPSSPGSEVLVTLEADGGIAEVVGLFPSHDAALSALTSKGKYAEL